MRKKTISNTLYTQKDIHVLKGINHHPFIPIRNMGNSSLDELLCLCGIFKWKTGDVSSSGYWTVQFISVSLLKMSSLPSFRGTVKKKSSQVPWYVHSSVVNMFKDVSSVNTHKSVWDAHYYSHLILRKQGCKGPRNVPQIRKLQVQKGKI